MLLTKARRNSASKETSYDFPFQLKKQYQKIRGRFTEKYTYEAIRSESTTRMLILHSGAYGDKLTGELDVASLDSCMPWKALSYAWGTTETYSSIRIGDAYIKISTNLDGALRMLRRKKGDGGFRVWVDQICIDQDNVKEQSQQVRLMYKIYEGAQKVLVWLGPDHDTIARKAFSALSLVSSLDARQMKQIRFGGPGDLAPLLKPLKELFYLPWVRTCSGPSQFLTIRV